MPLNGTFPYYSDGVVGESYGAGNYKATNGRLYKVTDDGTEGTPLAWYPAPGYRYATSGALWAVGNDGCSWASTSYDSGGHYRGMHSGFNVTWLNPSRVYYRGYGFQLRCLSDAQRLLARKQALSKIQGRLHPKANPGNRPPPLPSATPLFQMLHL